MLETVVFIGGAVLMALEILGSRVLAPDYGNSIFVWGSLIGVFLAALSVGYYIGGHLADRHPRLSFLAALMAGAGLLTFIIPLVSPKVTTALAALGWQGQRSGPLLASIALFFLPSVLMGTISPFAIRLRLVGLDQAGTAAGRLYALSSAGSLAGTFTTAFFLIPAFGVRDMVQILGLILLGLAMAGLIQQRRWAAVGLVAVLLLSTASSRFAAPGTEVAPQTVPQAVPEAASRYAGTEWAWGVETKTIYEADSFYHHIRVVEGGGSRFLRFDRSWQSGMYINDPYRSRFEYTDYFQLGMALRPDAKRVLFIGLGGGSAPKSFWRDYPGLEIDVAEIDPAVIDVARKFFGLPDDPRLSLHARDGRLFIDSSSEKYDLIVLDAYYADAVPFHLSTQEFFAKARKRLNRGGLIVINAIGALEGHNSRFFRSVYGTVGTSFPTRYVFPVGWKNDPNPKSMRNIILIAADGPPLTPAAVVSQARALGERLSLPQLAAFAEALFSGKIEASGTMILTDDHAPVDNLLPVEGL